jgi:RNA polymerase sigma-70 factor (ECF subfamily)
MDTTSLSLLERLQTTANPHDWQRFVRLYMPLLYRWARQAGAQEADAFDLVQDTLTMVYHKLPAFGHRRPGSFRAWMRTALVNRWRDLCRRQAVRPDLLADHDLDALAARDCEPQDSEDCQRLVVAALELIRPEFQPNTWQAFLEFFTSGQEAAVVAQRLGVSADVVYAAKSRVLRRLRQELDGLLH